MKILASFSVIVLISACASPDISTRHAVKEKIDKIMEKSSNYCLKRGFHGHEPEYRSCVIRNASDLLGISASKF